MLRHPHDAAAEDTTSHGDVKHAPTGALSHRHTDMLGFTWPCSMAPPAAAVSLACSGDPRAAGAGCVADACHSDVSSGVTRPHLPAARAHVQSRPPGTEELGRATQQNGMPRHGPATKHGGLLAVAAPRWPA
jgi:hypothetical protein